VVDIKNVLILGANSDISKQLIIKLSNLDARLTLFTRDTESLNLFLQSEIKDSKKISIFKIDLKNTVEFRKILDSLEYFPNIVISTIGQLTNSSHENFFENSILEEMININYLYPAKCIQIICDYYIKKKITDGTIVALSSVAGYRGRKKNYEYGAAKAAFSTFLSGLRNKLYNKIHIATIEPGFVRTKMTKNIKIPFFLTDSSEFLALKIMNVINNKKDSYTPMKWKIIMLIIKMIPEKIFKKLNL
jgi:decaprenylphospho-beta-D-erythro-pentofuranosid-2-ulose 2-reductase